MNTEAICTLNHEENTMTTVRPCILCDDRCCGHCRYFDAQTQSCSDGTPTTATSWCSSFSW